MKIAVLGTGMVGRTLAAKLAELGNEVQVGSRSAGEGKVVFAEAAAFGELVINATAGGASLEALGMAGADNLAGKVLLDVANPLDFSAGMPPTLTVCNTDSLGEQIQREFPDARVVKSLNTVNADVMVDPDIVPRPHNLFLCGNDDGAKAQVGELLQSFGWAAEELLDLGDISAARGTEMFLALWLRLYGAFGTGHLNVRVVAQ